MKCGLALGLLYSLLMQNTPSDLNKVHVRQAIGLSTVYSFITGYNFRLFVCFGLLAIVFFLSSISVADVLICKQVFSTAASHPGKKVYQQIPRSKALVVSTHKDVFRDSTELAIYMERAELARVLDTRKAFFHFEKYIQSLEPWERSAIAFYKGSGFSEINSFLRQVKQPEDWKNAPHLREIADLDHAIDAGPALPQGIVLFRGMALSHPANQIKNNGAILQDNGFVSTSLRSQTAVNFSGIGSPYGENSKTSIFQVIYVGSKKARGLYIESENMDFESEIVLDRGSRFRIIRSEWVTVENKPADTSTQIGGFFPAPGDGPLPPISGDQSTLPPLPGVEIGDYKKFPFQYDMFNLPDPKMDPMDPIPSWDFEKPQDLPVIPMPLPVPAKPQKVLIQYVELL